MTSVDTVSPASLIVYLDTEDVEFIDGVVIDDDVTYLNQEVNFDYQGAVPEWDGYDGE